MNPPKRWPRLEVLLLLIIVILLIIIAGVICRCGHCKPGKRPYPGQDSLHLSWNILLPRPTATDTIGEIIDKAEATITDYLVAQGFTAEAITFKPYYCPCDSLLVNLDVKVLDESGGSKVAPPGSGYPPPGATSGSLFASLQYNKPLGVPELLQSYPRKGRPDSPYVNTDIAPPRDTNGPLIVVIDSGIDSAFAVLGGFAKLLVHDNGHLYNFLPFADIRNNKDDDILMPHGTFVTSVIARPFNGNPAVANPARILALKALDKSGQGSSFSVSCALSYAIQQHAKIINASWGYYGEIDSVLMHYTGICNNAGISFVAAAGNLEGTHAPDSVSFALHPNTNGQLTAARPFYPAAFSQTMPFVLSVTGINNISNLPCYYQDYSSTYVSVGVKNTGHCCSYQPETFADMVEGSSFEAPVVTGNIAMYFVGSSPPVPQNGAIGYLSGLQIDPALVPFIFGGQYIKN